MEVFTQTELRLRQDEIIRKIRGGEIFIHPTDTIYGLGCNALDRKAVDKIRQFKERPTSPFSIWVPSLQWIRENCIIEERTEHWLKQLPGPYTLIVRLKNRDFLADNLAPGLEKVGIRLPTHWFGKIVEAAGVPIVTTSANKAGRPFMTCLKDLDPEIEKGVEFMIYEGEKIGRPSKIIDVEKGEESGR